MMPHPLLAPFLKTQPALIIDGAMATELEQRGQNLDDPLWSAKILLEKPELIRQVHYDYFVAGADVAITATYQATFAGLAEKGLSHSEATALMRFSVQLAQEARDDFWQTKHHRQNRHRPLIAASVGCYGAFLHDGSEYHGDYGLTQTELMAFHRPRLTVLANSGADLLACETIPCLLEAQALVELLVSINSTPAWLSFSCRDGQHLNHGEPLRAAIKLANTSPAVIAVGINCTDPRHVSSLLHSIHPISQQALLAYPNSGEHWNAQQQCWLPETGAGRLADYGSAWLKAGATLIGGCCRTTPTDIQALRHIIMAPANLNTPQSS